MTTVVVGSTADATVAGTRLADLCLALAQALGEVAQASTTAQAAATNQLVSAELRDDEADASRYAGRYVYALAPGVVAGQQARVRKSGFAGASGTLTLASGLGSAAPAGQRLVLLGVMPWLDQDGLIGLRTCVNRALRKLWVPDDLPFVGVAGQRDYPLGAHWWLSRDRVLGLLDPPPAGGGGPTPATQGFDVRKDGEAWYLELGAGYPAGDTFSLRVSRPASSRLRQGGVWSDLASPLAGLDADDDACLGDFNVLFQCALYECMKQLAVQAGGARKAYWTARLGEQRGVVSILKTYQMDDGDEAVLGGGATAAPGGAGFGLKGWW